MKKGKINRAEAATQYFGKLTSKERMMELEYNTILFEVKENIGYVTVKQAETR